MNKASVVSALPKIEGILLERVKEIIALPKFNSKATCRQQDPKTVEVSSKVVN